MADINIIAVNPLTRRVTFDFNAFPVKTRNMETLLQLCAKTVLTTPGKDFFRPEYGGGLLSYAGKNLSKNDLPRVYADMAYIIRVSEEQIIKEQLGMSLGTQERLRSLILISIDYIEGEEVLDVRALITSESGDQAEISLANQLRIKRNEV
jgi:hypothetical protein